MKVKQIAYQLLKKSEKFTGTDNFYIAKGGFWLSFSQVANNLIFLGLAMAWARLVPKETYGNYNFVISLASLLAIFSVGGMSTAIIRSTARGFDKTIKEAIKTKFKWSSLGVAAGFGLALYYYLKGNQILALSFFIAGSLSPLFNNLDIYTYYLTGKKKFSLKSKISFLRTLLASLAMIGAMALTNNIAYLALVYYLTNSLLHLWFYFFTLRKIKPSGGIEKQALSYGKKLSLIGIIVRIASQIDRILIFHYLGAAELAIYSFAILIPQHLNDLGSISNTLALPKLAVRKEKEIKQTLKKRGLLTLFSWAVVVLLYVVLAKFVFQIFFPQYLNSLFYSKLYALSLLANASFIPVVAFQAKGKTKKNFQYNLSTSLIKIGSYFVGLYFFGLTGLVAGHVIYSFLSSAVAFWLFRKA